MIRSDAQTIVRRLLNAYRQEWDHDSQTEFARMIGDLDGPAALTALDRWERTSKFLPTIAEFRAETIRVTREREQAFTAKAIPEPSTRDREAANFFVPRLKGILAGIGNGPQHGSQAACEALVREWHDQTPGHDESF